MKDFRDREILIIRLTSGALELLSGLTSRLLSLATNEKFLNLVMYIFLFVCIFTSSDWTTLNTTGELFRFDTFLFMGINIYSLYGGILFAILFIRKIVLRTDRNILGENNYLINIFWMYFVPVNLLVYFTIYIKDIEIYGLGIIHVVRSFVYVCTVYYIQHVFLKDKDRKQLTNILTGVEVIIFLRCCYSIVKYYLGFGTQILERGLGLGTGVHDTILRLGEENDFADFFILLFIIALTRLWFDKSENKYVRMLHVLSIIASSYISIMSLRRFVWGEYFVAGSMILFFHYRFNKEVVHKKIILASSIIVLMLSIILYIGPSKLQDNYYIGRFTSILSLVDKDFETKFGTQTSHVEEIVDGWLNVKKHWILGVSFFGGNLMERPRTAYQKGKEGTKYNVFIHNNYLYIWITYGLLGFILLIFLYVKSIRLGYGMFIKFKDSMGLILMVFMICQMVKNMIWHSVIALVNTTVIFILLISIVLRSKQLIMFLDMKNNEKDILNPDVLNSGMKRI